MHWLWKIPRLCTFWGTEMFHRTFHMNIKKLMPIQWGHQEVPAKFNFASDVIDHWASLEKAGKRSPGPALWWMNGSGEELKWNFRELSEISKQTANVLTRACGLQRGDRVAVVLPRVPEWWLVTLGCMRSGLVFMPGTTQMKSTDILYRLQSSKARAIVAGDEVVQEVDAVAPDCSFLKIKLLVSEKNREGWLNFKALLKDASPIHQCVETVSQESAAIYFTSGTSGPPKMAEHSHCSLGLKAKMDAGWTGLGPSDTMWTISDTGWILNILGSFLEPWVLGTCIFVHLLPKFDPQTVLKVLSSYPINTLLGAPLIYRMLLQQDLSSYKFPHLHSCFSGGETLLPETLESWKAKTGLEIREIYGQTETGITCRVSRTMKVKPGYLGTAIVPYDVQVIDEQGNVLPPGKEGDMALRVKPIRPIGMFSGYVDNPKKTQANIRGDFWLLGDRGIKDTEGYFHFMGRTDDIINSSGYRIGPSEVENALMEHPAVVETAVISSPDPIRREVVKAFVVLAPEFLSHDQDQLTKVLQEHVKSVTAPYKYPRKFSAQHSLHPGAKFHSCVPRTEKDCAQTLQASSPSYSLPVSFTVSVDYLNMQWLRRFLTPLGICKFLHRFSLHRPQLHRWLISGDGAQRWNDYDSPEEFNFASHVLDYWAQMEGEGKRGPGPALWWVNDQGDEIKWSFRELRDLSRRAANVFEQTCGLQHGDRLALILPRVPEWWLVTVGCIRTGVIFIPGTAQMKAKDILYRIQMSQAKAIVTTDSLVPEVESVASECPGLKTKIVVSDHNHEGWLNFRTLLRSASPDHTCVKSKMKDPMVIFFTSGTTGYPKMAKHNQGLAFRSSVPSCRKFLKLKTSDVIWCMSDPGWILATVGCLLEPWTAGATVFVHNLPQFDPKVIVETLFKYPITQCLAAPAVYRMVLQKNISNLRFPTLEHCATGGESLLPEEYEQWKQRTGLSIHEVYGQSETGITCAIFREMKVKRGSIGKAILPFDIQIIDEKGNILPPNTEGYIGIRIKPTRPLGLFVGYENSPEKTSEVECGDFYNSGDRATIDEDGYIWFLGRSDDVINASGYRIGPTEVENALVEHPAVSESAVVSSPDKDRGEVVKAFIVLNPEFLSHDQEQLIKELQEHVKSVTAPYKYPRKVEFVSELPKTITGKIKRKELRNKEFGQI